MIPGNRIRLRAVERDDLPLFVQWLNDPEVTEGLLITMPLSMKEEEAWFEQVMAHPPAERPLAIEIKDSDTWRLVGNCEFHDISPIHRSATVGIFIGDKSIWDSGYGTETMQVMLRFGFESLNLNRIALMVYDTNLRAIRVYEKVGFVHEGRLRQARYKNGRYGDNLLMSVLRSEWAPEKGSRGLRPRGKSSGGLRPRGKSSGVFDKHQAKEEQ